MNSLLKSLSAASKPQTPIGAGATAGAVVTIALGLLHGWHWYAAQSTTFQASVQTVLTVLAVYLAGWLKVVLAKNQQVSLELTPSRLPTVQNVAEEPAKV